MKSGNKTAGQIYNEALQQLKDNYFQHVGLTGVFYSAYMLFSSIIYIFFFVFYFLMIFGMMFPMFSLAGAAASKGDTPAGAVMASVLLFLAVLAVLIFLMTVVAMAVTIAVCAVQTAVQRGVLTLVGGGKLSLRDVWGNFKANWRRYLGVSAWITLWTFLWGLLFYVPGVVKYFSYMLAPYLVIEYPEMTVRQALRKSMEMTDGHKGKLFTITLIMIGLSMAASVVASFGLVFATVAAMIVFIYPHYFAMNTIAYLDLKQAAIEKGILPPTRDALPDQAVEIAGEGV